MDTGDHYVDCYDSGADPDRDILRHRAIAGGNDDDAEASELEDEIGNQGDEIDQRNQCTQGLTVVFADEEIGLRM